MVLTIMGITAVSPRGGASGTSVTITGVNFGGVAGAVTFDPAGLALAATVSSWADGVIVCTVPNGLPTDRFVQFKVARQDGTDFVLSPFWIPAAGTPALGYQWPSFEEGTSDEATDNPRRVQAADFNRAIDKIAAVVADGLSEEDVEAIVEAATDPISAALTAHTANTSNPHSTTAGQVGADPAGTAASAVAAHVAAGDPHAQYQKESEKGQANGYAGLDGSGQVPVAQLPNDGMGIVERETCPVTTQDQRAFTIGELPAGIDPGEAYLVINTARYHSGFFSISGTTLTWGGAFQLIPDRHDVRLYY